MSLIDLADSDPRSESPGVTRTPTPSSALWDTRGLTAAQAADLHAALSSLPKSFSTQLRKVFQVHKPLTILRRLLCQPEGLFERLPTVSTLSCPACHSLGPTRLVSSSHLTPLKRGAPSCLMTEISSAETEISTPGTGSTTTPR